MGYYMKHGNSAVPFKELGSSPIEYHTEGHTPGKKEIGPKVDPDAPGEPGTPGYEPEVKSTDYLEKLPTGPRAEVKPD